MLLEEKRLLAILVGSLYIALDLSPLHRTKKVSAAMVISLGLGFEESGIAARVLSSVEFPVAPKGVKVITKDTHRHLYCRVQSSQ